MRITQHHLNRFWPLLQAADLTWPRSWRRRLTHRAATTPATRPLVPAAPATIQDDFCATVTVIPYAGCQALNDLYTTAGGSSR